MAELAHLEEMGRELKCPICLSLLKSAVSLPCNHVYCNLCILESSKSVPDCPVCKVPFRRREVRVAPHMDNLVNIFKSMELSAGVSIHTIQVTLPAKGSDGLIEGNVVKDITKARNVVSCRGKSQKKLISKQKKREQAKDNSKGIDSLPTTMPSFPAKKRIHVMPFSVSETPARPVKVPKIATTAIGSEACRVDTKEKLTTDTNGDPLLSPFFWLREESADDDASQKLSTQQTADTPPPQYVPCFSDIKDSDDEVPTRMTPTSKPHVNKDFDSEMFEWTQRACSPELLSTPIKKQNADVYRPLAFQEKSCELDSLKDGSARGGPLAEIAESSKAIVAGEKTLGRNRIPMKKRQKHIKMTEYTATGKGSDKVLPDVSIACRDEDKNSMQKKEGTQSKLSLCPLRRCRKEYKPANSYKIKCAKRTKNQVNDLQIHEASEPLYMISPNEETSSEAMKLLRKNDITLDSEHINRKRIKQARFQSARRCMRSRDEAKADKLEVPSSPTNEANNDAQVSLHLNMDLPVMYEENSSVVCSRRPKETHKQVGGLEISKDNDQINPASIERAEAHCNQTPSDFNQESGIVSNKSLVLIQPSGDEILRKCKKVQSQICCAFCQSCNDTEVSGEMMHYFNGKPVAADYNGGTSVKRVHKHCTEWAPDVFFEDDLAINLASELARSRRIKCCFCGMRGAALGCFEKSCRKSFHFTCAKLIKECRWDIENFVMLCPLHSSSKLPNESLEHHSQRKRRARPNGEPRVPIVRRSGREMSGKWKWPIGNPCNWVLCCSALTIPEKEIISEFSSLTGIPVLKSWSPTVTHVIASTDENWACKRTLKFLMGVMEGKWILRIDWIKECLKTMEPVDEQKFEIQVDVHGISGGPLMGRERVYNKQPKLFDGFRFYLSGEFIPSYRGYLQDLILAAGGTVLQRKPISRDHKLLDDYSMQKTFIVYSLEVPEKHNKSQVNIVLIRQIEAQALADASGANVASNTWILDSIAACKLQPLV